VLFVVVEARTAHPLLPLRLFASRQFSGANLVTLFVYAALSGVMFLLPIQLQQVAHYSPLESGLALLPITFIMLLLSSRSGALAARIGPRLQMTAGPAVVAVGLILLARSNSPGGYLITVLPGVLVLGLGLATTVAPLTATVLAAAPSEEAGVASAVNNDVARAAGLLAVAILPAAAGITGDSYLHPTLFAEGFRTAVFICAGLCMVGALVAAAAIRNPPGKPAVAPPLHVAPVRSYTHCGVGAPPLR
jgi:MFS family permease